MSFEYPTNLRNNPMVQAWISNYKKVNNCNNDDCDRCGFPHSPHVLCGWGAIFGILTIGGDRYYVDTSNVNSFVQFNNGIKRGFHWKNDIFFNRLDNSVVVTYYEKYNNSPQKRTWVIPLNEWESIVKAVSHDAAITEMTTPLPEPAVINTHTPTGIKIYGYTADQLRQYGEAEYRRGIEDAAKFVENGSFLHDQASPKRFADEVVPLIRKLGKKS